MEVECQGWSVRYSKRATTVNVNARAPKMSSADALEGRSFIVVFELTPNNFQHERFESERSARKAAKNSWSSSVTFETAADASLIREVSTGGLHFGHGAIRRHASRELLMPPSARTYVLLVEKGVNNTLERQFDDEATARQAASASWPCCWVLFTQQSPSAPMCEVDHGGIGLAHDTLRRRASGADAGGDGGGGGTDDGGSMPSPWGLFRGFSSLHDKASAVEDPTLSQPLQDAVERLEAAKTSKGIDEDALPLEASAEPGPSIVGVADGAPSEATEAPPPPLRARFTAALAQKDDAACANGLVLLMQACLDGAEGGADDLIATLVKTFEASSPSDEEMVRLRAMQDTYTDGHRGYAVASAWLAALFVRTERCIAARSRLTQTVLSLDESQRTHLNHAGKRLVESAVPELLTLFGELAALVGKLSNDVAVQEVSVRVAKGVSAAMSITGSVLVFTPLLPMGIGLLASSAGVRSHTDPPTAHHAHPCLTTPPSFLLKTLLTLLAPSPSSHCAPQESA